MGTFKNHGWYKPGDDIPQPTSIIMGKNLSKPDHSAPSVDKPFGWDMQDIAQWIKDQKARKPRSR